ncbi:hypothetical protein SAMN05421803_11785 [Nocardiopsis flavescens]|uniref:Uncharacterized protein n=1 Tax=Nocardiopsis flavescens TaxID=758803 RepID=A0A1M6RFB1_9ACTN|nr:hypothetical protein SAMN05421803_11785 [Nocardiopsis flavescens]
MPRPGSQTDRGGGGAPGPARPEEDAVFHEALFQVPRPPLTEEDVRRIGHRAEALRRSRRERRARLGAWLRPVRHRREDAPRGRAA